MTERRRPLENDDGQGALFGGEAFAPAGPAPVWNRPNPAAAPAPGADATPDAPPFEARVDADATGAAETSTSRGFGPGTGAAPDADTDVTAPRGLEPGADPGALDAGAAARTTPSPFADEVAELERATDVRSPRSPRAPLAGPTLDDVMSRVWEGLATGLPAACPICHGEVVPALTGPPQGRCSSCATTIE